MVSVMVPGAVKTWPSNVYGKSFAHTSFVTVVVWSGSSLTMIVLIVSHPVPPIVSVIVPGALKKCPSKIYGKSFAQTSRTTNDVSNGNSLTIIVRMVSQPVPPIVSVMVPAAVKMWSSKIYGKSLAQTSLVIVVVSKGNSFTTIVRMVSQPAPPMVSVLVPCPVKS